MIDDAVLGSRAATLLDAEQVATLLPFDLRACRPRYARYKPETSLLVQYDLEFGDGAALPAHIWLYADDRARATWARPSYRRLVDRAGRRHPSLPPPVYLRGLDALAEVYPVDWRLPALVRAADPEKLRGVMPWLGRRSTELVRHKPGRKALLRYSGEGGVVYGKIYADGRGPRQLELTREVSAAGVPTAPAVAFSPELGTLVYSEAPGIRLADLRGDDSYAGWLEPAAAVLALLHHRVPPSVAGKPDDTVERLVVAGRAVDALVPGLGATDLARGLARDLAEASGPTTFLHGDFYDDQLLVSPSGVVVLDLDEARIGHPLVDVGNFLAHLSVSRECVRERFLESCEQEGIDLRRACAFEAAALLALAVGPFRRLEPDWPAGVAAIVSLARRRRLEDRRASSVILARAAAVPLGTADVEVVRHKPGRRSTLRYETESGRVLYAKVFASGRARRVHEALCALHAAGLCVPEPLGLAEEERLLLLGQVEGEPLKPFVLGGDARAAAATADVLHRLHTSSAILACRHSLEDELAPLEARAARLGDAAPDCLEQIRAAAERIDRWRWRPVHRDFYEDQVLLGPGGAALLDLDDAAMSEPALDVANLTAHLRLLALREPAAASRVEAFSLAFLRRYRARDPKLDPALVRLLEAATLLRLADIHPAWSRELLAESEARLVSAAKPPARPEVPAAR